MRNRIGAHSIIAGLIALRGFFDDIAAWGWAEAPARRLMFATDVPSPPQSFPGCSPRRGRRADGRGRRAAGPVRSRRVTVLRGTGLRIGELLDLELDASLDFGPAGPWLRVPLGKLNSERRVPLDAATLAASTSGSPTGAPSGPCPTPATAGCRLRVHRARPPDRPGPDPAGLREAVRAAGVTGPDGAGWTSSRTSSATLRDRAGECRDLLPRAHGAPGYSSPR